MPTPLQEKADDLAKQAEKAGTPRTEADQEVMTESAKNRINKTGRSAQNELYHGRPMGGRSSVGTHTRAGKFGLEVR